MIDNMTVYVRIKQLEQKLKKARSLERAATDPNILRIAKRIEQRMKSQIASLQAQVPSDHPEFPFLL